MATQKKKKNYVLERPLPNVKYYFRYYDENKDSDYILSFRFIREENGRYVFRCLEYGTEPSFSPQRFSFLARFNRVNADGSKYKKSADDVERQKKARTLETNKTTASKYLDTLLYATDEDKSNIEMSLGLPFNSVIAKFLSASTSGVMPDFNVGDVAGILVDIERRIKA